jgi:hypothetical protein
MAKQKKGPRQLVPPAALKQPKVEFRENWMEMRPAWRVSLLEMVDPFGWHIVGAGDADRIRQRLGHFESMYWRDIIGQHNHFIAANRICPDAQNRLNVLRQDDIDAVMSLRVTGAGRVWGIMEHNVMKVLWWDPQHLVYPVDIADN